MVAVRGCAHGDLYTVLSREYGSFGQVARNQRIRGHLAMHRLPSASMFFIFLLSGVFDLFCFGKWFLLLAFGVFCFGKWFLLLVSVGSRFGGSLGPVVDALSSLPLFTSIAPTGVSCDRLTQ